jgi:LacI family transcriptional regulator, gluconate utilization system Gnt-I transcriptional repressor
MTALSMMLQWPSGQRADVISAATAREQDISRQRSTLDDVAALAGVSPITVSRALRKPDMVSETLRERIEAAVNKLAYVPNAAASRLASAKSHSVGVIVPTLYNIIFSDYLHALHDGFIGSGMQVIVLNSRYSLEEEESAVRMLIGQRVEALIIVGISHTAQTRRLLSRARVPVIETFELSEDPIDINIGISQAQAGEAATRYLLDLGHRRIGFMLGHQDERAVARMRGYRQAMQRAGISTEELETSNPQQSSVSLGTTLMSALVDRPRLPEALFCIDDNLALGALFECLRRGLRVPDDISILGFHDLEFAACASPALSSVATGRYEMGRLAAEIATQIIAGRKRPTQRQIDVGFEVIPRLTTKACG